MGDLSDDFSRSEFACKCGCGFDTVDYILVEYLQSIRDYFGARVTITSGCRCVDYNEGVQIENVPRYIPYSSTSTHIYGRAADIVVEGVSPDDVSEYADSIGCGGVGSYKTFTHVDSRTKNGARW